MLQVYTMFHKHSRKCIILLNCMSACCAMFQNYLQVISYNFCKHCIIISHRQNFPKWYATISMQSSSILTHIETSLIRWPDKMVVDSTYFLLSCDSEMVVDKMILGQNGMDNMVRAISYKQNGSNFLYWFYSIEYHLY